MIVHQTIDLPTHSPHVLSAQAVGGVAAAKADIILLHGFPDTNWGWRKLLLPLARKGYNVHAPTLRGYGPTDRQRFTRVSDFAMEHICQDVADLMDALQITNKAVVVGHDWGGTVAWSFAAHFPQRVLAVCSFCTPYALPNPNSNPWLKMQQTGIKGRFAYQMVFQSDQAVEVLERDVERTVRVMMRGVQDDEAAPLSAEDAGLLMEIMWGKKQTTPPQQQQKAKAASTALLSEYDLAHYARQFTQSGFLNPVRWYRNVEANWEWNVRWLQQQQQLNKPVQLTLPSLMVTAENDPVLTPSMSNTMHPHFTQLEVVHVKRSTHWILQEQPEECARVLCDWLARVLPPSTTSSKL